MKFKLEIEMDNAAFDEPETGIELNRILEKVAYNLKWDVHSREGLKQACRDHGRIKDINGNTVGKFSVVK